MTRFIRSHGKSFFKVFIFIVMSLFIFYFFIKKQAIKIYCQREGEIKIGNFKFSVNKGGYLAMPEEEPHLNKDLRDLIKICLKKYRTEK